MTNELSQIIKQLQNQESQNNQKTEDISVFSLIRNTNGLNKETLSNQIKMAFARLLLNDRENILYPEVYDSIINRFCSWILKGDGYRNLLLFGGVGIGKTTCLKAISLVLSNTRAYGYTAFFSANSITNDKFINSDGWRIINTYPLVMIDDVGTEQTDLKIYGTGVFPIKTIIEERYLHRLPIIATTNLNISDFGDKYGKRVMDRIKEYDVITFDIDKSLRQ